MVSFTPAPTRHHEAWVVPQRKTRVRFRPRLSPTLPVFELSTQNRFSPLRETERDAVIIGDSIVRHVHATLGKSKVHSHCFPGARVSEIAARVPEILNGDERVGTVVLHAGVNNIRLRQTEILKKDFRNLIDTVRSTSPETTIIVSGPLPTYRLGHEKFSRLFALNEWLIFTPDQKYIVVAQLNTNQITLLEAPPIGIIGQCQVISTIELAEDVKPHLVDLDLKSSDLYVAEIGAGQAQKSSALRDPERVCSVSEWMIQQEKPLVGSMPVVWPTLLDLSRDECKRILRKLELEAYAGVISALRAQGDLTKDKKELLGELTRVLSISTERHRAEVRRAVNDERLNTIAYHMSGPNSSSEWSIEGRRLVPLMPRLVPQTAFTVTANAVANATAHQNASLMLPAETANKEVVVCYSYTSTSSTPPSASTPSSSAAATVKSPRPASPASNVVVLPSGSTVYVKSVSCSDEDEKPRKRRRTNSSSSSPVLLKEGPKLATPLSKTITVPVSGSPKMSNLMQSIANSLPPHMSPVKITFTKPSTQTTNTTTQKVIIVTTSPSSNFVPNILSKSHNYAAVSKLVSSAALTASNQKQTMVISAGSCAAPGPSAVAVTTVVSSSPSVVMSTIAQGGSSTALKMSSTRLPSPKALIGSSPQILQIPKAQQTVQCVSPKALQALASPQGSGPGAKPTIQIKQESGVKIITQQMQPSKILPKPSGAAPSSSSAPIMVVSSNGAIMTTKLVSNPTGTQATYTRPSVSPALGTRVSSPAGATYVKTTSGSIITVVPKSLATLGGKIITSSMVPSPRWGAKSSPAAWCQVRGGQHTHTHTGQHTHQHTHTHINTHTHTHIIITIVPKSLATLGGKIITSSMMSGEGRPTHTHTGQHTHQHTHTHTSSPSCPSPSPRWAARSSPAA
ncbi:unnamed protein product [Leuciscus chuanchicus]